MVNRTVVLLILVFLFASNAFAESSRKPLIGINVEASGEDEVARLSLGSEYIDAVTSAGGIPVLLPPITTLQDVPRHVELCDGFVLTGGKDVNPERYGQQPCEANTPLLARREDYDFRLINEILRSRKPVLAVCLGSQELNVAMGGSLIQDIASQTSSTIDHHRKDTRHETAHTVSIKTGSRLADIVATTTLVVNSVHHQSCARPGNSVLYLAHAPDGIVEAYELTNYPFALAVQWHPESLSDRPEQLALYRALVREAARKRR